MKKIFNITDKKEIKDKKIYKGIILGRKISKILKKENSIENKKSKIKFKNENIKDKKFNGIIRKSKIKFRLIISYSILVLIPLLIVGTTAVLQSKKSIDNKISNFSNQIMEQIGVNIYSEMNKASDFARTIIAEPQIQEYFNGNDNSVADYIKISELSKSIRSMISTQNNMTGVGIITEDNKKIGSFSNQLSDMLVKELQELSDEKKGKFVFSLNKSPSGYKIYGCAQAKSLETGEKFGTIIEEINPKLFVDLFKNVDLGKGSSIFVIDSDGLIVLSSNSSLIGTQYENVNLVEKIKANGISNGKKKDKYLSTDDGKELVAYSKLGDSDWYVLGSIPYSYLDRESNILKINTIIVSLISFLVAMIAALVIEKSISNPLKKLVLLMNEGKKGNLNLNIIDRSNDEIGEAITGMRSIASGKIFFKNEDITNISIRKRINSGIAHIPEDRQKRGLVLDYTMENNMVLEIYNREPFSKRGLLNKKAIHEYAEKIINEFDVRSGQGGASIARGLSGGNQQKAIIGREIELDPELLIAVQPTRGLDVGSIEYIHKRLIEQRDAGKAVLLVSLELSEILNLSDRIAIVNNGELIGIVNAKETNENEVGLMMAGVKGGEKSE